MKALVSLLCRASLNKILEIREINLASAVRFYIAFREKLCVIVFVHVLLFFCFQMQPRYHSLRVTGSARA